MTTIREDFWTFDGAWELSAYAGSDPDADKVVLKAGTGQVAMKTQGTPGPAGENPTPPRPASRVPKVGAPVDITWLLERFQEDDALQVMSTHPHPHFQGFSHD